MEKWNFDGKWSHNFIIIVANETIQLDKLKQFVIPDIAFFDRFSNTRRINTERIDRNSLPCSLSLLLPPTNIKETAELCPPPDKFIPIACRGILNRKFVKRRSCEQRKCKVGWSERSNTGGKERNNFSATGTITLSFPSLLSLRFRLPQIRDIKD